MHNALMPAPGVPVPLTKYELAEAWTLYNLARRRRHGEQVPERIAHARYTVTSDAITLDLAPAGITVTLRTRPKRASEIITRTAAPDWVPKADVICGTWTVQDRDLCEAAISAS